MSLAYTTRPLHDRTWLRPDSRRVSSRFDVTWSKTLQQLGSEIDHLRGRNVVIEVDVREQDIRNDGMLRANAKAETPAVIVAFETPELGPMLYRSDRYDDSWSNRPGWQENVRAVVLTLEALRAVDRYGATQTGQQYTGFKAIGASTTALGSGSSATRPAMSSSEAALLIRSYAIPGVTLKEAWRAGVRRLHPDANHGNTTAEWLRLQEAAKVLGLAS